MAPREKVQKGDTVVVTSEYSSFRGSVGRVAAVRPFDILVNLTDWRSPLHRSITLPFGRGELQTVIGA